MNVLVTGAAGFIGSHLIGPLSLSHTVKTCGKKSDLFSIDTIIDSVQDYSDWRGLLTKTEAVVHLLGKAHVNEKHNLNYDNYKIVNVDATLSFAKDCIESGVKRFVFISTINVFGIKSVKPLTLLSPYAPSGIGGITKLEVESKLRELASNSDMELVIIRSPLVYGPRVKANFAAIMKLASIGIPLPFGGINKNKRSMVYIGNLVDLIITCITNPRAANQTILVSDDDDLSTARMIKELSLALGNKGWMLPVPVTLFEWLGKITGKSAMIERLCGSLQVDISKTKQLLDWKPPFSVEEGFAETAKYFLNNK